MLYHAVERVRIVDVVPWLMSTMSTGWMGPPPLTMPLGVVGVFGKGLDWVVFPRAGRLYPRVWFLDVSH